MTIPIADQITEAKRELNMRLLKYPQWVERGSLRQRDADRQLERLKAIIETLVAAQAAERPGLVL